MKNIVLIALCSAMLVACKKEEGVGGDASISGQVWTYEIEIDGTFINTVREFPAEDTYVYIVYGDNTGYDKRIKTDYNGYFNFNYLYPGNYTLYVYSFDPYDEIDERSPVIRQVEIKERKENVEVERIEILKLQ
jgi:predicted small secreted protein